MATTPEIPCPHGALKHVFHEPSRMAIVTTLCAREDGCTFGELKTQCGLTDGNLNRHLNALVENGMVQCRKITRRSRGCTQVEVTDTGREQFVAYLRSLEDVLRYTACALAGQEELDGRSWLWSLAAAK